MGLAAWIVEKFEAWSDDGGDIESRFTKDELLTNITLYWVTRTIGTSFPAYRDFTETGMIRSAAEMAKQTAGGHFAALEESQYLVENLHASFRPLRSANPE